MTSIQQFAKLQLNMTKIFFMKKTILFGVIAGLCGCVVQPTQDYSQDDKLGNNMKTEVILDNPKVGFNKKHPISWKKTPEIFYTKNDLKGQVRKLLLSVEANEKGEVTNVVVKRSSGIDALDKKVIDAVMLSKFEPYFQNGEYYPVIVPLPIELE